jgi:hypothetical protein
VKSGWRRPRSWSSFAAAEARAEEADRTEPRARAATFDPVTRRVRIELKNGCAYEFPADLCQGLRGVSADVLAQVEVYPYGIGLRWDSLDIDFSIPGLVAGRFGNKAWMRQIESELADKDMAESTPKANVTPATSKATRRVPHGRKAETDPAAAA